jgi:prolyl-tRNA editing enzyme YbaK/EbsC (Cys-tRNA(Pro) deacylase)
MTMDLHYIYIDGGKRGFLVNMPLAQLYRMLQPTLVYVAIADR